MSPKCHSVLVALMLLGASPVAAQTSAPPPPSASEPTSLAPPVDPKAVNQPSEAEQRISLDAWRPEDCPKPTRPGEIVVCGRPEEQQQQRVPTPPPVLGDRLTDVPTEREALLGPGVAGPGSCSAVGAGGEYGCSQQAIDAWKAERAARKAEEAGVPQ